MALVGQVFFGGELLVEARGLEDDAQLRVDCIATLRRIDAEDFTTAPGWDLFQVPPVFLLIYCATSSFTAVPWSGILTHTTPASAS